MKLLSFLAAGLALTPQLASAAKSWVGSNLYYAAGLTSDQQQALFTQLQASGVKVLRVWLDGQSGTVKGTPINSFPSLESSSPGVYDDTVLNRLDDVMYNAHQYGIKLLISIYSFNALQANTDFYGKWYGTGDFYTDSNAISYFQNRIWHVLAHVNPHNGKPWSQCSEYIFAFEAQNEAMNDSQTNLEEYGPTWQCTMAQSLKSALNGNTGILVTTGGGGWVDVSLLDGYFSCQYLDVLAIHAYGAGDLTTSKLSPYVTKAQNAGKKLLMQEWGACYWDTPNNSCGQDTALSSSARASNFNNWAGQISQAGIPWMYWQVLPNADPHQDWDYEIGITESFFSTFQKTAQGTSSYTAAFDYSAYLLS